MPTPTQTLVVRSMAPVIDGVAINVTKMSSEITREQLDATDTGTYDPLTDNIYASYVGGKVSGEGSFDGNFNLNGSSINLINKILTNGGPVSGVMRLDTDQGLTTGLIVIEKISVDGPIANICTISCSWKYTGKFTSP